MTLHSSKGLEFKCVFIAGLENEILPLYRAKTTNEIEEERRLFVCWYDTYKKKDYSFHEQKKEKWIGGYKNLPISPFLEKN